MAETVAEPTFRGCAFVDASAEGPLDDNKVRQVCNDHRAWVRALFTTLVREVGVADPALVGGQLALLYDGAIVGASMDRNPDAVSDARAMAESLLESGSSARRSKSARAKRR